MVITSPHDKYEEHQSVKLDFPLSNNQAEYEALLMGMAWALSVEIRSLRAYNDSQVVVSQVNNDFAVHSENLKAYAEKAANLKDKFRYFELHKLSSAKNEVVDRLTKIASREAPNDDDIEIELCSQTSSVQPLRQAEPEEKSWIDDVKDYIIEDILPPDPEKARQVRRRAVRYAVLNDVLYRRSFTKPLLRCVPQPVRNMVWKNSMKVSAADTKGPDQYPTK